ncbi:hydroxyacylglutathione hydrolase [Marinihelvus fidelis]|uniref:Hydroxyacylglutathione hydrolase n=1 Tax=Marinihelvus fidelis TaxID=2613842 RepID=A0A5N0TDP2_9GAMM|nr:hydroxyacylglutathione hydrolase [Marinihelvus fidelis]KAA9133125.1 hydroxyacylglutathione hydrolase [Marinihelvus fidelis]
MHPEDLVIEPIPAFNDNYIWLLHRGGDHCVIVDPGDHEPVLDVLAARGLAPDAILLTHHHWDHADGVPGVLEQFDVPVYGPADDRLGDWCTRCHEGDTVSVESLGLSFNVFDVPAHTRSHIAFVGHGAAFTGDTLFSVGCGRLFEGTADDMQRAMDKLATLPGETKIYCGHEYTVANCAFALQVEPDNAALAERAEQASEFRAQGHPTLPSTIKDELRTNPFMRTREPAVVTAARRHDAGAGPGASTMAAIRAWKDRS